MILMIYVKNIISHQMKKFILKKLKIKNSFIMEKFQKIQINFMEEAFFIIKKIIFYIKDYLKII